MWSVRVSDTLIHGHAPNTCWIRVRYATWRIVDQTVGQMIWTRLGHGEDTTRHDSIVLISDFNLQQRRKEERERRWEAEGGGVPLVPGFQHKGEGRRGEDENRDGCWNQRGGWVLGEGGESRGVGRG